MSKIGEHGIDECECEGGPKHNYAGEDCIYDGGSTRHKIFDCGYHT